MSDQTKPDGTSTPTEPLNPFSGWIIEQRGGLLHSELSEQLAICAAAAIEHEKNSTLTLTVTISPSKLGGAVEISDRVSSKPAEPDRRPSLFYATGGGNLSRRDPRQPELPFSRD